MNRSLRASYQRGRSLPLIDLAHGDASRPVRADTPPVHEQLRIVALTLFVEHGFQAVSLRQLAMALGMQAGSLYNHMESKQILLFELIEEHETDLLDLLEADDPWQADGLTRLRSYVDLHIRYNLMHQHRLVLARRESRCLSAEQRASIEATRQAHVDHLEKILRQIPSPAAAEQSSAVARSLMSILEDAPTWWSPDDAPAVEGFIAVVTHMAVGGLAGPSAEQSLPLARSA